MSNLGYAIQVFLFQLTWLSVLDILLVTLVIFGLLALVRGTQAVVLLRGIIILGVATVILTSFLRLPAFSWLLRNSLPALIFSVPVIFAPEIRRALERLGRAGAGININTHEAEQEQVIEAITTAAVRLSERRHGAPTLA
jgi:diadenylate cyclase